MKATVQDVVARLTTFPTRRAVGVRARFGLRWWTYQELLAEVMDAAAVLADRGVGPGTRVLLWAPNSPEWVAWFLALAWRGAVAVLVDAEQPLAFVEQVLAETRPAVVLHTPLGPQGSTGPLWLPLRRVSDVHPGTRPAPPAVPVGPDAPVAVLYSSGTTAVPKGVVLSHGNLLAQLEPFQRWRLGLRLVRARMLFVPPLSRSLGLVLGVLLPLSIGLSVFYVTDSSAPHLARVIRDNRALVVVAVPGLLRALRHTLLRSRGDDDAPTLEERLAGRSPLGTRWRLWRARRRLLGRHCRLLIVGGADLPLAEERFWRASGLLVLQGYGLTETSAIISISNPFSWRPGTLGTPVGTQEVRLAEDGELLVRGPNLSPGYLSPEGSVRPPPLEEGFFPTGDLARRTGDGQLVFLGRKKELIVTSEGHNVFPAEVEAVLDEQPELRESAVLERAGAAGVEVHALLVVRPGADAALAVRRANQLLQAHQRVSSWSVWPGEALPRGGLRKLKRAELAAALRSLPEAASAPPPESPGQVLDALLAEGERDRRLALLERYISMGGEARGRGLGLGADLGLSSLDRVELLTRLEGRLGVPASEALVGPEMTVAELCARLQGVPRAPGAAPLPPSRRLPGRQPGYAMKGPVRALRRLTRALVVGAWALTGPRVQVRWHCAPQALHGPALFAAEPHWHWLDGLLVYRALRAHLGGQVSIVTNRDFREHFDPPPGTPRALRWLAAFFFYVGLPLVFPFSILTPSGRPGLGLQQAGALLDRRLSQVCFPLGMAWEPERLADAGVAVLAAESGYPLVPVYLEGTTGLRWNWHWAGRKVTVHVGAPLRIAPDTPPSRVARLLRRAFLALRSADGKA